MHSLSQVSFVLYSMVNCPLTKVVNPIAKGSKFLAKRHKVCLPHLITVRHFEECISLYR